MKRLELLKYAQNGIIQNLQIEEARKAMLNERGMASPIADHRIGKLNADWKELQESMLLEEKGSKVGCCPECGSSDCDCYHETMDGGELSIWSQCSECGHQFIEVFEIKRVEKWSDRR